MGIMDKDIEMRLGIKSMLSQYDHYFTRAPHTRYWLVVVDNHFEDCYSFFIYMQRFKAKLIKSYEIACFKRDKGQYEHFLVLVQIFLADLILVYWVPRNEGLRA